MAHCICCEWHYSTPLSNVVDRFIRSRQESWPALTCGKKSPVGLFGQYRKGDTAPLATSRPLAVQSSWRLLGLYSPNSFRYQLVDGARWVLACKAIPHRSPVTLRPLCLSSSLQNLVPMDLEPRGVGNSPSALCCWAEDPREASTHEDVLSMAVTRGNARLLLATRGKNRSHAVRCDLLFEPGWR